MQNYIDQAIKLFNPVQLISVGILIVISYFKLKNQHKEVKDELKKQVDGLGSRFDNQFGEYKDKNSDKMNEFEHRLFKLEIEASIIHSNKSIEEKVDKLLSTSTKS